MKHDLPKFRTDLTVSEQPTANGPVLVVKDPLSGAFFRLGDLARFLASQCDGATSVEVIRQRAEKEFGGSLPQEVFKHFLVSLEKAGLLESGHTPSPRRRLRGSLLYLRFRICNPDALLTWLARRGRGLFFRRFDAVGG